MWIAHVRSFMWIAHVRSFLRMEHTARRGHERKMLTVNNVAPAAHTSTKIPSYFWPRVISGAAYAGVPQVVLSGSPGKRLNQRY
jgi:hypothetical protein